MAAEEILLPFNLMSNPDNEVAADNPFNVEVVVDNPVNVEVVIADVDVVVSIFLSRTPEIEMSEVMVREGTVGVV